MGICHSKKAEINDSECQHTPISTKSVKCDEIIDRYNFVSANATAVSVTPKASQTVRSVKNSNPRAIFVSLYKLSQQWDCIPADILMDSIVVINGCRQQMFPQTIEDMRLSVDWPLFKLDFTEHFKQFIQCKDAQGSVIWMRQMEDATTDCDEERNTVRSDSALDLEAVGSQSSMNERKSISEGSKVSLKVRFISEQLGSIIDPFTRYYYSELWDGSVTTQYDCDTVNACDGNFKALMKVLKKWNPTLIPMIGFNQTEYETENNRIKCNAAFNDNTSIASEQKFEQSYSEFGDIEDKNGFVWLDYDSTTDV